jgi:endogenous inhibitor of DNA gyrase (YacG/DUF329 family)
VEVVDHMHRRPSSLRSSLPCPQCGRSLVPVPTETSVTFHCKSGHTIDVMEALQGQSAALKVGLESLLYEWGRQHHAIIEIVDDATRRGHVDVAQIFGRHARTLEARIQVLKDAFQQTDSAKLLKVPSSIRRN